MTTGSRHQVAHRVAIIGAGFSGLCMAIQLKRGGVRDFVVFDKGSDVGGVWRDNVYPGCGCDVPSHLYSYSFARYSGWTRAYPKQEEILDYLHTCVRRWKLGPHLQLDTEIVSARWEPQEGLWRLRDASGCEYTARVLVCGVGQLNRPRYPSVPGREAFQGAAFHSARWDPAWPPEAFAGRDVAVIGTGPSAVQFVPEIASYARRLYVFQRSANWVIPKYDYAFGAAARWAFRRIPGLRLAMRGFMYAVVGEALLYSAIAGSSLGRGVQRFSRRHMHKQIPDDAELRAKLTPDFPIGCKRILISDDWYPALARDNVEVVTEAVTEVTSSGVRTADGRERDVTVLIYGTGFRATEFLAPIDIVGRGGARLQERWREGASAYLGMAVPEFPNMFLLYGPTTNLGHNSVVYMIESQVRYIMRWLRAARGGHVEVAEEALAEYDATMRRLLARTAWEGGCTSWYKTADGRVTNNWPLRSYRYRMATNRPRARDFLAP
ncbi:flavin-containing monooxygenase [Catenulispora sp. GAS73]|uniref:flavin-containing monooxygenase n=1 Tax=Catenulispora sp. GAS73 TaxID=3156269 RepID=UPI003513D79C